MLKTLYLLKASEKVKNFLILKKNFLNEKLNIVLSNRSISFLMIMLFVASVWLGIVTSDLPIKMVGNLYLKFLTYHESFIHKNFKFQIQFWGCFNNDWDCCWAKKIPQELLPNFSTPSKTYNSVLKDGTTLTQDQTLTEIKRYLTILLDNAKGIIQKGLPALSELIERGLLTSPEGRFLQGGFHTALTYNILICDYMLDFLPRYGDTGYFFHSSVEERLLYFKNVREICYTLMKLNHDLAQISSSDILIQKKIFIEFEKNFILLLQTILKIKD